MSSSRSTYTTASFALIKLAILFAAVFIGGLAASTGDTKILVLMLGMTLGLFIALDYRLLLLATLFGGLVASGLAQLYVPSLELVRWGVAGAAVLLIVHIVLASIKNNSLQLRIDSAILFWAVVFFGMLVLSVFIHQVESSVAIVSLKGYFQVWGVLLAIALLPWTSEQINRLPLFMLLIAIIQIPFVLHQYLILVPWRRTLTHVEGLVPIDIVSGTFGGQIDHGGANAALTLLCFIVASGVLCAWRNKVLSTKIFVVLIVSVLFPAFINSTKISGLYMLAILLTIYYDEIFTNPVKFLMRFGVTILLCAALAFSVISSLPDNAQVNSLSELYEQTYNYNIAEDNIRDNRLSRSGTINAWLDPVGGHRFGDIIFGYGIGSSRIINSDGGARISSAINLERPTGVTAIAAILWETGIIGLLVICMLFISAFAVASRLRRIYKHELFLRSMFTAAQCSVLVMFISLGHKSFFTFHIGFQTLFVVVFGYLAYWERRSLELVRPRGPVLPLPTLDQLRDKGQY